MSSCHVSQRSRASTLPTPEELCTLPVHHASVSAFNTNFLRSCLPSSLQQRFDRLVELFEGPLDDLPPKPSRTLPASNMEQRHVDELLRAGIVVEVSRDDPNWEACHAYAEGTVAFLVSESEKGRMRPILWPQAQNEVVRHMRRTAPDTEELWSLPLPGPQQIRAGATAQAVALFDLRAAFFQFGLGANGRVRMSFRLRGRLFSFCRLPMGHAASCHLLQLCSLSLLLAGNPAQLTVHGVKATELDCGDVTKRGDDVVCGQVYIDNVRLFGAPEPVRRRFDAALCCAREAGATLKEAETSFAAPPLRSYVWLGAEFVRGDDGCVVRPGGRTRRDLLALLAALEAEPLEEVPGRTLLRASGQVVWAAGLCDVALAQFHTALLLLRKLSHHLGRRRIAAAKTVSLGRTAANQLHELLKRILGGWLAPRNGVHGDGTGLLRVFSDASLSGWGVVLLGDSGFFRSFGGRWPPPERRHINCLEADALRRAAAEVHRHLPVVRPIPLRVVFAVDSQVVLHAVRKGWSRSRELALLVAEARAALEEIPLEWALEWVASGDNLADAPSRDTGGAAQG